MSCKVVGKLCKVVGSENLPAQIDLTDFVERLWSSSRGAGIVSLGTFVRPTEFNRTGYEYEATIGGQVLPDEPAWPRTIGATVQDGSVVWTCRAIGNNSLLKTINSVEWDGDGFDITDEEVVDSGGRQMASCFIGSDLDLGKYTVKATVTFSDGHVEIFGIEVKMENAP